MEDEKTFNVPNSTTVSVQEAGETGFVCKVCSKGFSISSNLNRHVKRFHGANYNSASNIVSKSTFCTMCEYKCRDKYQLKVHMRSHTKEKPFSCSLCSATFSKKEDCKRHMKSCKGPKYKCENCQTTFKSRKAVNEHYIWDQVCGTLANQGEDLDEKKAGDDSNKSIVKIIINRDMSVVGVNCNKLLDEDIFEKKIRRTKCGLCYNCTVVDNCGNCKVCLNNPESSTKQVCLKKSCNNPIELFELRKSNLVPTIELVEANQIEDNLNTAEKKEAGCDSSEDKSAVKSNILIDGPVDMFNEFFVEDPNLCISINDGYCYTSPSNSCILMNEDVLQV